MRRRWRPSIMPDGTRFCVGRIGTVPGVSLHTVTHVAIEFWFEGVNFVGAEAVRILNSDGVEIFFLKLAPTGHFDG